MLKTDFLDRVEGMPWRNRACSFEGADCWGLIVLYYRHVLDTELHNVPGYEADHDFITCFDNEIVFWQQHRAFSENDMFVAYYGSQPVHVGLIINGRALHSRGENGHVRSDQIRTIQKLYSRVEFYTYANHRNTEGARPAPGTHQRAGGSTF